MYFAIRLVFRSENKSFVLIVHVQGGGLVVYGAEWHRLRPASVSNTGLLTWLALVPDSRLS